MSIRLQGTPTIQRAIVAALMALFLGAFGVHTQRLE